MRNLALAARVGAATMRLWSASSSRASRSITAAVRRADHRAHLLEVEAALEHAEPMKHLLAIRREEVVTPGDRAFECPLARGCVARSAARQRQTGRQPVADDRRRKDRDASCRKFDAERQVVEQVADLGDHRARPRPAPSRRGPRGPAR